MEVETYHTLAILHCMTSLPLPSDGKSDSETAVSAQPGFGALEFLTDFYRKQVVASNRPEAQAAADKAFSAGPEVFAARPLQ